MVTKVQKWGNSQGLRLAKQVLVDARISDQRKAFGDIKEFASWENMATL